MKTLFVVCQHGDEKTPLAVIKGNFGSQCEILIANQAALEADKRFMESDLNRSFPGSAQGTAEEKIANKILPVLLKYDYVVDLHTASKPTPLFIIMTKVSSEHLGLAKKFGATKIVQMQKSLATGKALIDHVPVGISIESGKEGDKKTYSAVKLALENYLSNQIPEIECEYYQVFQILKREQSDERLAPSIKPFVLVKKGQPLTNYRSADEDFYPVLPRERYPGVLSMMAKRVSALI